MFILAILFTHKEAPNDLLYFESVENVYCHGGGRLFEGRSTLDKEILRVS